MSLFVCSDHKNFFWKVDYGTYEAAGMADMEMVRQPTQVKRLF